MSIGLRIYKGYEVCGYMCLRFKLLGIGIRVKDDKKLYKLCVMI
jgi:hypothetical protein